MDKRKSRVIPVKHIKKKIYELSVPLGNALFGAFCCFLGIYMTISLAKNGSGIFYYAMAFASPGTAIEILSTPPNEENDLSTELSEEEEISVPEPEKEVFPEENPAFEEKIIPEVPENRRGKVTEIKYSAAEGGLYVSYGNAIIKNCTKHSAEKIKAMLETKHGLFLSTEEKDEPQVLIYHTHATEGFEPADRGYFDLSESWRSTDKTENMVAVGEVITSVLEEKGIKPEPKFESKIDIALDAYLPEKYIKNESQRMDIYKKIAHIECADYLDDLADELMDRFGDIPRQADTLMYVALARALCEKARIPKIEHHGDTITVLPEQLDPMRWAKASSDANVQLTFRMSGKPSINYKMKGARPLYDVCEVLKYYISAGEESK